MKTVIMMCVALGVGCGGSDDIDMAAESADATTHASSTTTLTYAKSISSLFVQEDPTLDISKSAADNADSVAAQLKSASCAGAAITHSMGMTTVSVDFGTGCVIPHIGTVSGTVSASVSKQIGSIKVAFTLTGVVVNGLALAGSVMLSTADATTFTATADLTEGTNHFTFSGSAVLDSDGSGVTLTGTGTAEAGSAPMVAFTATGVHHGFKSCYADAGTLGISKNTLGKRGTMVALTETVVFDAQTPSTGKVVTTINGVSATTTLAAYGSCPHA